MFCLIFRQVHVDASLDEQFILGRVACASYLTFIPESHLFGSGIKMQCRNFVAGETAMIRGSCMFTVVSSAYGETQISRSAAAPHELIYRGLPECMINTCRQFLSITKVMIANHRIPPQQLERVLDAFPFKIACYLLHCASADVAIAAQPRGDPFMDSAPLAFGELDDRPFTVVFDKLDVVGIEGDRTRVLELLSDSLRTAISGIHAVQNHVKAEWGLVLSDERQCADNCHRLDEDVDEFDARLAVYVVSWRQC